MHVVDGGVAFVLGGSEVVVDFWEGAFEVAVDVERGGGGCHDSCWKGRL